MGDYRVVYAINDTPKTKYECGSEVVQVSLRHWRGGLCGQSRRGFRENVPLLAGGRRRLHSALEGALPARAAD